MNSDMLLVMKWEKFLISLGEKKPHRSRELKLMLREGISPQFRGKVWKMYVSEDLLIAALIYPTFLSLISVFLLN